MFYSEGLERLYGKEEKTQQGQREAKSVLTNKEGGSPSWGGKKGNPTPVTINHSRFHLYATGQWAALFLTLKWIIKEQWLLLHLGAAALPWCSRFHLIHNAWSCQSQTLRCVCLEEDYPLRHEVTLRITVLCTVTLKEDWKQKMSSTFILNLIREQYSKMWLGIRETLQHLPNMVLQTVSLLMRGTHWQQKAQTASHISGEEMRGLQTIAK